MTAAWTSHRIRRLSTEANAETVPIWGLSSYYDHFWNDQWATTVGWSMIDLDTSDGQDSTEFKQGQIATINLLHYPADHVMLGTEFSWGEREDISGNVGSDYRVQFSLKVDFDSGDLLLTLIARRQRCSRSIADYLPLRAHTPGQSHPPVLDVDSKCIARSFDEHPTEVISDGFSIPDQRADYWAQAAVVGRAWAAAAARADDTATSRSRRPAAHSRTSCRWRNSSPFRGCGSCACSRKPGGGRCHRLCPPGPAHQCRAVFRRISPRDGFLGAG